MRSRWTEYILNLIFWFITAWFIVGGFSIQSQEIEIENGVEAIHTIRNESIIVQLIICICTACLLFYSNLLNILRLNKPNHKKPLILLLSVALFFIFIGVYFLVLNQITIKTFLPLPVTLSIGIFLFYFVISTAYGFGKNLVMADKMHQQLLLEKKQAELTMLRNQLQPHFLFNALNNLLSMVDQQKSPLLADSIERLSGLLRYVVDETSSEKVTVKKEIEFIRNYVKLLQLRYEPGEIDFIMDVIGNHYTQNIEPGLFISFVDNAFKYGTEPEHRATIEMTFDISKENELGFTIKNDILNHFSESERKGTGIITTVERLKHVYPLSHILTISQNKQFIVELKIKTNESHHRR